VERGHIVFTREGYRQLLYQMPGYALFLKAVMSTHTVVSVGHSATDAYINDIRSEIVTMMNMSRKMPNGQEHWPLTHSIQCPRTASDAQFAKRYDAMNFLDWSKKAEKYDGFDRILQLLFKHTNPRAQFHELLVGRQIIVVDNAEEGQAPKAGWSIADMVQLLHLCRPSIIIKRVRNYEEMERAKEAAFTTFDLAIALFDEDTDDLLVANRKSDYYIPVAVVKSSKYWKPQAQCYGTVSNGSIAILETFQGVIEYIYEFFRRMSKALDDQLGQKDKYSYIHSIDQE